MAAEHTLAVQKGHTMMHTYIYINPLTNVPTKCQPSTTYGIQEIADRFLQIKVTTARSMVKSRSHHDDPHLHLLMNVPTRYQLPTPYGF